ncbi:MAG: PP2C family protein-serine/threonine phosphatase [Phycisphaerae bacterium]|nr:PP2C family protein-serine/threonine phosphatase [Phycisphaerae bacterium]
MDLLAAFIITCFTIICLLTFLVDNVVPTGTNSYAISGAGEASLSCTRAMYAVGLFTLAFQMHFVLRYRNMRNFLSRHIWLVYALLILPTPFVWSKWFLQQRTEPLSSQSSWVCAVPWFPHFGPLVLLYIGIWLTVLTIMLVLLYRPVSQARETVNHFFKRIGAFRLSFVIGGVGGLLDAFLGGANWAGITIIPITAVFVAVILSTAMVMDRLDTERKQQHLDREMELASRIQRGLLPQTPPVVDRFELVGWSHPANHTGGDTYDFVPLSDGQWMITLGDASGHGMGPALVIAETRALLRAISRGFTCPSLILYEADQILSVDLIEDMFVTCFVGVLDTTTNMLTFASAGQGPILFFDRSAERFSEIRPTVPPLGISLVPKPGNGNLKQQFNIGDLLVLVSDGFYETFNRQGEMFGIQRLKESLLRHCNLPGAEMIASVRGDVNCFVEATDHPDDLTMVVLQRF